MRSQWKTTIRAVTVIILTTCESRELAWGIQEHTRTINPATSWLDLKWIVLFFDGLADLQQQSQMSSSLLTSQQDGNFVQAIRTPAMDYGMGDWFKNVSEIKELII